MRASVFLKLTVLSFVLLVSNVTLQARGFDGNLIYNSEEKDGVMIGQTVYKMDNGSLTNYMKHDYKYDDNKRMVETETQKWNGKTKQWDNDLRSTHAYAGKSITTNYYKWNAKESKYILAPEMSVTMDNPNL